MTGTGCPDPGSARAGGPGSSTINVHARSPPGTGTRQESSGELGGAQAQQPPPRARGVQHTRTHACARASGVRTRTHAPGMHMQPPPQNPFIPQIPQAARLCPGAEPQLHPLVLPPPAGGAMGHGVGPPSGPPRPNFKGYEAMGKLRHGVGPPPFACTTLGGSRCTRGRQGPPHAKNPTVAPQKNTPFF